MKWKQYILPALLVIAIIYIIVKAFGAGKSTSREDRLLEMLLAEKDSAISRERTDRIAEGIRHDKEKAEFRARDSISQLRSTTNTIRYERVPINVRNLDHDELRSAVLERYAMFPD